MLVPNYQTTRFKIQEDSSPNIHSRENLKI
jgi:hypothetical protein